MVQLNHVVLAGNLTKDPDLRQAGVSSLCAFGLAVNRRYKDSQKEEVSFFDVECWGNLAENCAQHLRKGRGVIVEGRLKQDRWEAQGGGMRSRVVIVAESVQFLGSPKDAQQAQDAPQQDPAAIDFDS